MAESVYIGSRLREKRIAVGLTQIALAQKVGISAPFLNMIEHDRRRISPELLMQFADILGISADVLNVNSDPDLIAHISAAALGADMDDADASEVVAHYPKWATLIADQSARVTKLQARLRRMEDRMAHDPAFADMMHEVISSVTAIRSTASILTDTDVLDPDWQRRFHQNIYDDSVRLADKSAELVKSLNTPQEQANPQEQVAAFWQKTGFHAPALEAGAVARFVANAGLARAATQILQADCTRYVADAARLPQHTFAKAARACAYDPLVLAETFDVDLPLVLRRLATLSEDHPKVGLVIADATGTVLFHRPLPGFPTDIGCPLWPLYQAFTLPDQPIRTLAALPDPGPRFLCYAVSARRTRPTFDSPAVLESTMLVLPDPSDTALNPRPVGIACPICLRTDCAARHSPRRAFDTAR